MRRYAILDVFTDTPLAGNPLAVVLDGEGFDDREMQAVAAEFNLSETVFVRPPENRLHSASIRIYTPRRELPFAGHPTVGTAVLLALGGAANSNGSTHERMIVLEEKVGPVRCGVSVKGERTGHAIFDLPRRPMAIGDGDSREAVAEAVGLMPSEIGFENHRPTRFTAGAPYLFVPVRDLSVIARARPVLPAFVATVGTETVGAFLYCRETARGGHHFHARMFAPHSGIAEDPATGSAAAAFAGVVRRFDEPTDGSHRTVIEQGFEMGRPSLIGLEIDVEGGEIASARISGDAVVIAEGELHL